MPFSPPEMRFKCVDIANPIQQSMTLSALNYAPTNSPPHPLSMRIFITLALLATAAARLSKKSAKKSAKKAGPVCKDYSGSYLAFKNWVTGDFGGDFTSFITIQQDNNCLATGSIQHGNSHSKADNFSGYIMGDKLYYQEAFTSEAWNFELEGVFSFSDNNNYGYGLEHHDATDNSLAFSGYFELFTGTTEQMEIMIEYGFYISANIIDRDYNYNP